MQHDNIPCSGGGGGYRDAATVRPVSEKRVGRCGGNFPAERGCHVQGEADGRD